MYLNGTKTCSLLLCCFMSFSLIAKDAKITTGQGLQKPLSFIENKGQVLDDNNNPRYDIQYKLSTPGMNLYLGSGKLFYQFRKTEGTTPETMQVSTYNMGVALLGANPDAKMIASDEQEYHENYYRSQNDNGFTVHSFNKVTYKDVYPNIDWVLYVKDNNVEYDFVVRPGGDISKIKLSYDGATRLSITDDGSISAETPMGNVKERKPFAYETGSHKEIASNFKLHNNIVSFEAGDYHGSLTIDPYLLWSTYFGGVNEDVATSVKETSGGLTFAGGYTASTTLGFGGAGVYNKVYPGGTYDAFLTSYTATGTRTYTTYFGGATGNTEGTCIALDNTGAAPNIYLAGFSNAPATGLTTGGAYHAANNGGNDGFLIKFTNAGARSWCTFYGGSGDDFIYGVTCDAGNNVYITGQTASAALVASAGAYQAALSGPTDAFAAKFNAAGAIQWSTYFGGSALEEGLAIACDASSNVIIGGQTNSIVGIATATAFQSTLNGTNDGFVAKFTTAGALTWGTYYGGEGAEQVNGVACNPANSSIAIVGNTTSLTNVASAKANQPAYGGGTQDAFVAYFTSAGAEAWSTYYGGTSLDYGQGVCFDLFNNITVAGGTFSSNGISTPGSFQPAIGGDYDAYIGKFNALGQIIWGTYFGGTFYDYANGIACDLTNDQLVIAGYTVSTAGIATAGTAQTVFGGGTYDAFVTKFKKDTLVAINQPYTDTLVCAGSTYNVAYTTNFNFQAVNTFTAQLSDVTGSFAAPVTIGVVTANTSGTIACTIPAGTIPGTGYRIRIVSSSPAFTSPDDFYDITILAVLPPSTASGSTPVCVGATIYLYDTADYVVTSYNWIGPAGSGLGGIGFTATTQNTTNTGFSGTGVGGGDAGTYSVVTTHNGCPNDTAPVTIVVNKNYPPTPSDSATNPSCVGSAIYLFANSDTAVAGITFYWTGPNGFTSTLQNPSIPVATALNAGKYFVTDTMAGCASAMDSIVVIVNTVTPVSVSITASPSDTVCLGTLVTFTATTMTGGVMPGFQWMTGPVSPVVGAVSSTWSTSSLVNGSTVFCIMSSDIVCPSPINANSNIITMDVIDSPPLVNIAASPGTYVPSGSTVVFTAYIYNAGAPTYQWSVNGVNIPGATVDTFTLTNITQRDTVTVTVTSNLICAVPNFATSTLYIDVPNDGVANVTAALDNIGLFPNPNNGSFTIKGDLGNTNISTVGIKVFDLIGQQIYSDNITPQNNKLNKTFDFNHTPDGIYMMNITGDNGQSKILRFTIQH